MKNYLLALLLLGLLQFGQAQTADNARPFRLGLTFAPNIGWLNPSSNDISKGSSTLRLGYGFGLITEFGLANSDNYYFSTGFQLSTNGGKLRYAEAVADSDTSFALGIADRTYALRYINIPLTLKMRTNEIGRYYYYGLFGGSLGFNITSTGDDEYNWATATTLSTTEEDIDIADDIRLFRTEMIVGGGIEIPISGNTKAMAGLTWHSGFSNVLDGRSFSPNANGVAQLDENGQPAEGADEKATSNYISIDLGIFF